uniref:Uncharacterized protein n=1 Tax=Aegilops tauschii subsp. strangulata TaxID=200361 RepID=A0A452Y4E9_AEGTS
MILHVHFRPHYCLCGQKKFVITCSIYVINCPSTNIFRRLFMYVYTG